MNFHSLLRVDKSRKKSKKYTAMEDILTEMIDNIVNNRNIVLDNKLHKVDPSKPELNVYIGSDMGFCANLNALVKRTLTEEFESEEGKAILKSLGIEGDYEGIGHCILGYPEGEAKPAAPRKESYIYRIG